MYRLAEEVPLSQRHAGHILQSYGEPTIVKPTQSEAEPVAVHEGGGGEEELLATCEAIKNNGKRCEAKVQTGSQWCWNHDPAHTAKRKASGSMGGKRGGRGRPLLELQQTKAYLKKLRDEVLAGVVDRGDATIANQITNTYVRCISTELQVREQLELRERMELLEAEVEAAAAARGYGGGSRPGMDYGA